MDKKVLRGVLADLNEGDVITVNFRGDLASQSGDYKVESKRRGRGKGGSILADLVSVNSEDTKLVIGTPKNSELLNLVIDGTLHGHEKESDVPLFFEPSPEASSKLKESFKVFLSEDACPKKVEVVSTENTLNGTFTVTKGVQKRGRPGQIALLTEEGVELWSYRHSGAIQSFKVLD